MHFLVAHSELGPDSVRPIDVGLTAPGQELSAGAVLVHTCFGYDGSSSPVIAYF
jgi:hypothetical protein